jgi:hypothetical protein
MREGKLKSDGNRQGKLKQKGVKRKGVKPGLGVQVKFLQAALECDISIIIIIIIIILLFSFTSTTRAWSFKSGC